MQQATRVRVRIATRRGISIPAVASTTQKVTLPVIPELYSPDFLDALLPVKQGLAPTAEPAVDTPSIEAQNAMMDVLKESAHRTFTENGAPAYASTGSPVLDAFQALRPRAHGSNISRYLREAWKEDPELTLRIIWNVRSIHDGKGEKELFYQ